MVPALTMTVPSHAPVILDIVVMVLFAMTTTNVLSTQTTAILMLLVLTLTAPSHVLATADTLEMESPVLTMTNARTTHTHVTSILLASTKPAAMTAHVTSAGKVTVKPAPTLTNVPTPSFATLSTTATLTPDASTRTAHLSAAATTATPETVSPVSTLTNARQTMQTNVMPTPVVLIQMVPTLANAMTAGPATLLTPVPVVPMSTNAPLSPLPEILKCSVTSMLLAQTTKVHTLADATLATAEMDSC